MARRALVVAAFAAVFAVAGFILSSCKKSPRKPAASSAPTRATRTTVIDAGPPSLPDAAPPDAAQLSFEQAQLADDVALQVRQLAPGRFTLPKSLHTRFMKDHLFHAAALGHLEPFTMPSGKASLIVHVGPSTILTNLGLREGDVILKVNGRLVDHEKPLPEAIFLRILLKLEDGEVDVDLFRGPALEVVHLSLKLLEKS